MAEDQEKQHTPTSKKLEDARRKGEIVRSQEVNTALVYISFAGGFLIVLQQQLYELFYVLKNLLSLKEIDHSIAFLQKAPPHLQSSIQSITIYLLPLLASLPLSVILFNLARRGIVFNLENLLPKKNRISPLAGIKNKFGANGIFEFARSLIKASIFLAILLYVISPPFDQFSQFALLEYKSTLTYIRSEIISILAIVSLLSVALAIVDYAWQHHQFMKKNMMSQQELKDEFKESEGDPHFKAIRRQKGAELTSQQLSDAIRDADVVIVNPTHFAVALSWNPEKHSAPIIAALGLDHRALHIRQLALEMMVPIFVDIPTARALATIQDVGDVIPHEHFAAVAAAIRFSQRKLR